MIGGLPNERQRARLHGTPAGPLRWSRNYSWCTPSNYLDAAHAKTKEKLDAVKADYAGTEHAKKAEVNWRRWLLPMAIHEKPGNRRPHEDGAGRWREHTWY